MMGRLGRAAGRGVAAGLLVLLVVAYVLSGPPEAVDWSRGRVIALESDDWGLAGLFPDSAALASVDPGLSGSADYPAIYNLSTLETSTDVEALAAVLAECRGRDGLPAVLQPNYIVSSLWLAPDDVVGNWSEYDLPLLPPVWSRDGLWQAVDEAIDAGVWHPEFHGRYHFDPDLRRQAVVDSPEARRAAELGVLLFPGGPTAFELGPWRDRDSIRDELDHSLSVFGELFGRSPASVIAPDYLWTADVEQLWQSRGLLTIQAKREQRSLRESTLPVRARKWLRRWWDRRVHPRRSYLERNCRLETAQANDRDRVVADCVADVRRAWATGRPAIVESHRINFVCLDKSVSAEGRAALGALLLEVTAADEPAPLFVVDDEIARLNRFGVSQRCFGDTIVLRNLTRGTRTVYLVADEPEKSTLREVSLKPGSTVLLTAVPDVR